YFFFSSRIRYTIFSRDWSSDVCSSDLFGEGGHHFGSPEALVKALAPRLDADSVVLVKGSRFMRMERVADALAAMHNSAPSKETEIGRASCREGVLNFDLRLYI